jgi:type III secretory pathway component EscU
MKAIITVVSWSLIVLFLCLGIIDSIDDDYRIHRQEQMSKAALGVFMWNGK